MARHDTWKTFVDTAWHHIVLKPISKHGATRLDTEHPCGSVFLHQSEVRLMMMIQSLQCREWQKKKQGNQFDRKPRSPGNKNGRSVVIPNQHGMTVIIKTYIHAQMILHSSLLHEENIVPPGLSRSGTGFSLQSWERT